MYITISNDMQSQKQRFFPSFVTYSECLLVAILTFSVSLLCFFKDERERVYSTISLGIKRGKGNKIENHKKILSKWRNLVSNSSGKWKKALKSHFWQAQAASCQFRVFGNNKSRVVKRDTKWCLKNSLCFTVKTQ